MSLLKTGDVLEMQNFEHKQNGNTINFKFPKNMKGLFLLLEELPFDQENFDAEKALNKLGWFKKQTRPSAQDEWFSLVEKLGKDGAKAELARKLRMAADMVESEKEEMLDPGVYGCRCPPDDWAEQTFITEISVTFSYPWPG